MNEDLNTDPRFKIVPVSEKYAVNDDGDGNDKRSAAFTRLLGVRDAAAPCREATADEMEVVAIALYSYFVKRYLEGADTGFWERWHEENDFPRHEFQSHSTRGADDGVFHGFDFDEYATENLMNGLDGVNAIIVLPRCTSGPRRQNFSVYHGSMRQESYAGGLRAGHVAAAAALLSPGVRHVRIGLLAAKRNGDFGTRGIRAVVASPSAHRLDVGRRNSPSVVTSCPRRA